MKPGLKFIAQQVNEIRRVKHSDGREYLVAPIIPIKQTVMNGLFYPAEEISRIEQAWNGIPVTLGHPQFQGHYVSAGDPDIDATHTIGRVWKSKVDQDGTLRAEAWIDIEKVNRLGSAAEEVLHRIEFHEPTEVSTGVWVDEERNPGIYNSKRYDAVARNLVPDHLAVLLNEMGACSWKDGCGLPRSNEDEDQHEDEPRISARGKVLQMIANALGVEIEINESEDQDMKRDEMIKALLECNDCGLEKDDLKALSDEGLEFIYNKVIVANQENDEEPEDPKPESRKDEDQVEDEEAQEPEANETLNGLAALVDELGGVEKVREALTGVSQNVDEERAEIVKALSENKACAFDKKELEAMEIQQLRKLYRSLEPAAADYTGRGFQIRSSKDEGDLSAPPAPQIVTAPVTNENGKK